MVAGGAGGYAASNQYTQGYGGTLCGGDPLFSTYQNYLGNGATQTSGGAAPTKSPAAQSNGTAGSFGKGGYGGANGPSDARNGGGSGGGSGYYGGSGASGLSNGVFPGGGGSSYISGYAGVNSVLESTTITHTNQTLHYSGKYFIGGKMLAGQNEGNGYAKITYVREKPEKKTTKLNGVRYIKNCINNDSVNNSNAWVEMQAIKDGINIAKGKVGNLYDSSGNVVAPLGTNYAYSYVTDGNIDNVEGSKGYAAGTTHTGLQCFIVDLGQEYDLDEIAVWHYGRDNRTYYDDITSVSSDNKEYTEIINETMYENNSGKRLNAYTDTYNGYIQDNLVLWLDSYANTGTTRNHTTTTWKDLSGTGNNVTVSGATWYHNYLSLDGTKDYGTIPYSSTLASSEFSIDITFSKKGIVNNTKSILFVKWYGYTIELNADNTVVFGTRSSTTEFPYLSGGEIELNKIYNIVVTYKNNEEKIYLNGELKNSRTNTASTFSHSATAVSIGRYNSSYYSNVNINQIKFYTKALTEDEILHNYLYDVEKFNIE